jgi:hypothetical protein
LLRGGRGCIRRGGLWRDRGRRRLSLRWRSGRRGLRYLRRRRTLHLRVR